MLDIKDFMKEVHTLARKKGWYDSSRSPLELLALIHSEISEAVECIRKNESPYFKSPEGKPEGELAELADAVIRIFDYCEYYDLDLESAIKAKHIYNKSRPYRHGNKRF